MDTRRIEPALVGALREGYSRSLFVRDLMAGVLVGIVALPLSLALAIASGVEPQQGLITAVVAGFLISAFGGSRVQIGGPTGAFIVLVYQVVQDHGVQGLAVATLMAGAILVLMGFARLGSVIRYIPYPVTVGFTAGIAVIIFVSQLRDFFGLRMGTVPADFLEKLAAYGEHVRDVSLPALAVGAGSLALLVLWPRLTRRVPAALVTLVVATLAVRLFSLEIDTIGSRFGAMPTGLPMPKVPDLDLELVRELIQPATAIALLAGIESLLSAVVADGMTGRRHDSNTELVAQGIANLASPLFGGIPATGALARTATNVKAGGATPIAGIIHACTVLLVLLVFGRWAALVPMPALAAILMIVAFNMGEWHLLRGMLRSPRSDVLVMLTTFWLTLLVDLIAAIEVGVVLAALLFMRRMAEVADVVRMEEVLGNGEGTGRPDLPAGVEAFELRGAFFFGAADKFRDALQAVGSSPRVLILRLGAVPAIDSTGLRALEDIVHKARQVGTTVMLSEVRPQLRRALERSGAVEKVGLANVHLDFDEAVRAATAVARS